MRKVLIGAVLCAASMGACAQATYTATFSGQGYEVFNAYNCPGQICTSQGQTITWRGIITVVTALSGDGVFSQDDLTLSVVSNYGDFTVGGEGGSYLPNGPLSATIVGGALASLMGPYSPDPYTRFQFSGLTATYSFGDCHHCNTRAASATITPVPEPATYWLLIAGLVTVAVFGHKRTRHSALNHALRGVSFVLP